jgi:hypothetical protein
LMRTTMSSALSPSPGLPMLTEMPPLPCSKPAETQALLEAVRQRAEKAQRAAATRARNKAAKQD